MRIISVALLLFSSAYSAQANAALPARVYFVPQCSTAAQLMGDMAIAYRNDKDARTSSIGIVMEGMFSMKSAYVPTLEQFNVALVVMESLVSTKMGMSDEPLRKQIIAEAAATCMAASLEANSPGANP